MFYCRFRSINTVAIAIAMIIAIAAPTMYNIRSAVVAKFEAVVAVGAGVAANVSTAKLASADDG